MITLYIVIKPQADRALWVAALEAAGVLYRDYPNLPRHFVVQDDPDQFPLRDHAAIESLETVEPVFKTKGWVDIDTNYFSYNGNWGILRHTSRAAPWGAGVFKLPQSHLFACHRTGSGVDVYVVDTGCLTTHAELSGRAAVVYQFTVNADTPSHGTATMSCAGGANMGLARGALLWSVQIFDEASASPSLPTLTAAYDAMLAHYNSRVTLDRPAVANMSFTGYGTSSFYTSMIASIVSAGIVCVAAAGNERAHLATVDAFPAEEPGVILVGGTNMGDGPYDNGSDGDGTNYGTEINILGAAQHVMAAHSSGTNLYALWSGTSFGTPFVTGVVACMLQGYRRLISSSQVQQVAKYLYDNATFGKYKPDPRFEPMTPAIAYLDPGLGPYPSIPTLIPV